jgi:chromate reductase, NAD(P)H dehydrogenase (quinone)
MERTLTILGIAGSLRRASMNRGALRAAQELVPEGVKIEIFDLDGIPTFNQDEEKNLPAKVKELKERIRAADGILFSTPEYNYSIPGVLKNAIDWGSRPSGDSAWNDKPVAVMGASPSNLGTSRAQYHLRQSFIYLNMHPMNRPEVMISQAHERFDEQGNLKDAKTKELIKKMLQNFVQWIRQVEAGKSVSNKASAG